MSQAQRNINQILSHLDHFGIRDKDAMLGAVKKKNSAVSTIRKREVMRRRLDLHGMTISQAIPVLRNAIDECKSKGIGELLVIHGYGRHSTPMGAGVLKQAVITFLEEKGDADIRDYMPAMRKDGGEGATMIRF